MALAAVLAVLLVVSLVAPLVTPGTPPPSQPSPASTTITPVAGTPSTAAEGSEAIAYYETLTGQDVFGTGATLVNAASATPVPGTVRLFVDSNEAAVTAALDLGVGLRYVGDEFSVLEISGELLPAAVVKLEESGAKKIAQQPA